MDVTMRSPDKQWTVEVSIDEHPRAPAPRPRCRWRNQEMTAIGIAWLNLSDCNVTNVGDELAMNWPSHERCRTWRICSPRRHQTSTRPRTSRS